MWDPHNSHSLLFYIPSSPGILYSAPLVLKTQSFLCLTLNIKLLFFEKDVKFINKQWVLRETSATAGRSIHCVHAT